MYRSRINSAINTFCVNIFCINIFYVNIFCSAILFLSCGFIDLRPIEVSTSPGAQDTILSGEYSPLSVSFNTGMEKREAENLLMVSSDLGTVEGDRIWNGNTLLFIPAAGWAAGTRYTMGLSGTARSVDGRELRIERSISFYAINRSPPPFVERHYPADGESVRTGTHIELFFSCPMDKISVELSLNINGLGEKKYEWSNDDKTIKVIPEKNFSPWTVYRWTLSNGAKSKEGVPLAKEIAAVFSTDLDRELPVVSRVYPVIQSNGIWFPTGGSLEEKFGPGLGIAVEFSKPMEEAASRSLRFEPSLAGRTEKLTEKNIVFIPTRDPDPNTVYTLIISGEAKDTEGLKIGADYRCVFIADIPYLRITSVDVYNGASIDPAANSVLQVPVSEVDGGRIRFTIKFSQLFNEEAKQKTALSVSLIPFFPSNLDHIALRFVSWFSDDMLNMEWERLEAGTSDKPHYYRLLIPGGRNGIDNGGGIYLEQEISLYLEAVK